MCGGTFLAITLQRVKQCDLLCISALRGPRQHHVDQGKTFTRSFTNKTTVSHFKQPYTTTLYLKKLNHCYIFK